MAAPLVEARHVRKLASEDRPESVILDDINFTMREGEFVYVVGPSGCGKSMFLRLVAGLEAPSSGQVLFRGEPVLPEDSRISMVFQNFALFPWMTVEENVGIGLESQGVPKKRRDESSKRMIEMVGLAGNENAYPYELSGGMKQMVGVARALAVNPVLMVMDEPYSALDPLTAEGLRNEILRLWLSKEFPPEAVLAVGHNIEEAVMLADRVVVFTKRPAHIRETVEIGLPYPRNKNNRQVRKLIDRVYGLLT
jgi:NitT/TauT family transport system ATP-binding protein